MLVPNGIPDAHDGTAAVHDDRPMALSTNVHERCRHLDALTGLAREAFWHQIHLEANLIREEETVVRRPSLLARIWRASTSLCVEFGHYVDTRFRHVFMAALALLLPAPVSTVVFVLAMGELFYLDELRTAKKERKQRRHRHAPCEHCGWCACRGPSR